MIENDKIVREALKAAKADMSDEALAMLDRLKGVDPKPLLYWYALSQARLRQGEHELAYNCLFGFCAKLHNKHMELLGLTRSGTVDHKLLGALNGPPEILNEREQADAHRNHKDYARAAECLGKVVMWRIDELKRLGFDVFA